MSNFPGGMALLVFRQTGPSLWRNVKSDPTVERIIGVVLQRVRSVPNILTKCRVGTESVCGLALLARENNVHDVMEEESFFLLRKRCGVQLHCILGIWFSFQQRNWSLRLISPSMMTGNEKQAAELWTENICVSVVFVALNICTQFHVGCLARKKTNTLLPTEIQRCTAQIRAVIFTKLTGLNLLHLSSAKNVGEQFWV